MLAKHRKWLVAVAALAVVGGALAVMMRHEIRRLLFIYRSPAAVGAGGEQLQPVVPVAGQPAARAIALEKVAGGFSRPTDVQFVPGSSTRMVVLEQGGAGRWMNLDDGRLGLLMSVRVLADSEQGLLGLAFHPSFLDNGRYYVNYVHGQGGGRTTRIAEWTHTSPDDFAKGTASETRVVLEVEQPYDNHNGGQLAFGPDGYLYIGMGDGGLRDDPAGHGQNRGTLLAAMLRIDVDRRQGGRAYGIPADNPFRAQGEAPELWAVGLRNPWRFSFAPDGRLVVADVGQDVWEEIDIVRGGDNLGWNVREAFVCLDGSDACADTFVAPIHAYDHNVGASVTGGFVYDGSAVAALKGRYVFADFTTGRFFALQLPADRAQVQTSLAAESLGRWPILPVTFGRDAAGELYVAGFGQGNVYRLTAATGR